MFSFIVLPLPFLIVFLGPYQRYPEKASQESLCEMKPCELEPTIKGTSCDRTQEDLRLYTDSTHGLLEPKKKLKTCTFSLSLFHTGPLVLCKRVKPKVGDNNSCHTNHMKWQRKRSPFKAIKSYISIIILTNTKTSGPRQFRLVNRTQSAFLQKKYIWRQPSLSKMNGRKSEFVIWLTFWFIRIL